MPTEKDRIAGSPQDKSPHSVHLQVRGLVKKEGNQYLASFPAIKLMASGETPQGAMDNLQRQMNVMVHFLLEDGALVDEMRDCMVDIGRKADMLEFTDNTPEYKQMVIDEEQLRQQMRRMVIDNYLQMLASTNSVFWTATPVGNRQDKETVYAVNSLVPA